MKPPRQYDSSSFKGIEHSVNALLRVYHLFKTSYNNHILKSITNLVVGYCFQFCFLIKHYCSIKVNGEVPTTSHRQIIMASNVPNNDVFPFCSNTTLSFLSTSKNLKNARRPPIALSQSYKSKNTKAKLYQVAFRDTVDHLSHPTSFLSKHTADVSQPPCPERIICRLTGKQVGRAIGTKML